MTQEPKGKQTCVFIDGQNLFHSIKEAFGYPYPNYEITKLAEWVCQSNGWYLKSTHFYTGIPSELDNKKWNHFWSAKLADMGRKGIKLFKRPLRYRNQFIKLDDGSVKTVPVGQEKGVDVRIALDIVRAVRMKECDVAVVFSQDQDLSEVADEVRTIAAEQGRWVKIASVVPISASATNKKGINKTDWIMLDKQMYDKCIDPNDYRLKKIGE
jgi:uncharacterized LabA/DUF88 family protein